jgi:thiol-disulfide isomerase/thioredoxin
MFRFAARVLSAAALTACLAGAPPAQEPAGDGPRYRFEPDTELVYLGDRKTEGTIDITRRTRLNIWVLRKNADGSHRLIVRTETKLVIRGDAREPQVEFGFCDARDDGTFDPARATTSATLALPPLPAPSAWRDAAAKVAHDGTTYRYRILPADDSGDLVVRYDTDSVENRIYDLTASATVRFDPELSLPRTIESRSSQGYGFQTTSEGRLELMVVQTHYDDWVARLAVELEACANAQDCYRARIASAAKDPTELDLAAAEAKRALAQALDGLEIDQVREQLQRMLDRHDASTKYAKEDAERFAKLRGQPSAAWESTDFDDRPQSIARHAGEVVVLDFWYRGCGWCIKAMPQIQEVARHFAEQPVVVLGMNTDRKDEDARFVIDAMGLGYPTVRAQGLPEKYGVRGFPTVVLIDRKGVVRDFHVGYAPDLSQTLIGAIDELLAER